MRRIQQQGYGLRQACLGFTLLELLVVLVIMGILVGLAVINISGNDPDRALAYEAQRLQQCLRLAGEEAVENNQTLGVRFQQGSYGFLQYDGVQWTPPTDPPCRPHQLPVWMGWDLAIEGQQPMASQKGQPAPPQLWILASGEYTPFTVRLLGTDMSYQIQGDLLGRMRVERLMP